MRKCKLSIVVLLSLSIVVLATRAQAQQSTDPSEYALNDVQIANLAEEAFQSETTVRTASSTAASVMADKGGCVGRGWILNTAGEVPSAELAGRIMAVYSSVTEVEFAPGNNPECFTKKGLTWAIMDNVLEVDGVDLGVFRPNKVSGNAMGSAIFRHAFAHNKADSGYISTVDLMEATKHITGHSPVDYSMDSKVGPLLARFSDMPKGEALDGAVVSGRYSRLSVNSMYHTEFFEPTTVSRTDTSLAFSLNPQDSHVASFWADYFPFLQHVLNKYIGLLEHLAEATKQKIEEVFMGVGTTDLEREGYVLRIFENVIQRGMVGVPLFRNMINDTADALVDDPNLSTTAHEYIEYARTLVLDESDMMATAILLTALSVPEAARIALVEGAAINHAILTNVSPDSSLLGEVTQWMQDGIAEVWDGSLPPDPEELEDWDGSLPPDPEESEDDLEGDVGAGTLRAEQAVGTLASTQTTGYSLSNDPLAKHLSTTGARMDYAFEATWQDAGAWNEFLGLTDVLPAYAVLEPSLQGRVFFTHPRLIPPKKRDGVQPPSEQRFSTTIRIRLYDKVGLGAGLDFGLVDLAGWIGMKAAHELIIPINMNHRWGDAQVGDIEWRNNYNLIVQGDTTADTEKVKEYVDSFSNVCRCAPEFTGLKDKILTAGGPIVYVTTLKGNVKYEGGGGYGIAFTYNLTELVKHPRLAFGLLAFAVIGIVGGGALAYEYLGPVFGLIGGAHGTVAAVHFGAELGWLVADGIAVALLRVNSEGDLVKFSHGAFAFGAAKPFKYASGAWSANFHLKYTRYFGRDAQDLD